jgi:hypothetical protein
MQYVSYEEMEEAVADRYDQTILNLERKIDELKLEVSIAEEEAEQYEARNREAEVLWVWMGENHPDILTTFNVLQRLEDSHEI